MSLSTVSTCTRSCRSPTRRLTSSRPIAQVALGINRQTYGLAHDLVASRKVTAPCVQIVGEVGGDLRAAAGRFAPCRTRFTCNAGSMSANARRQALIGQARRIPVLCLLTSCCKRAAGPSSASAAPSMADDVLRPCHAPPSLARPVFLLRHDRRTGAERVRQPR